MSNFSKIVLITLLVFCSLLCTVNARRDRRLSRRSKRAIEWGPDIVGPYCATRRDGCCPGRIDSCSVPILGTLCYCDEFCDRTRSDCCPDFYSFCRNQQTTPAPIKTPCIYNSRPYAFNTTVKNNCNLCTCAVSSTSSTGFDWRCETNVCLIRDKIINGVNDRNLGWQASNYSKFWGMTLNDGIRYRLGTYKPDGLVLSMNPIEVQHNGRLPANFDSRQKWPGFVHGVRDQGNCASSWAFSTAALASDRLSIESGGLARDDLSPQNLLSCNHYGQNGCKGGYLDRAWWYMRKRGIAVDDCYPYSSGNSGKRGTCRIRRSLGANCPSGVGRVQRLFEATPPYRISMSERDIMAEIEMNGPVQATFRVKDDFYMYKSGVYRYANIQPDAVPPEQDKYSYHSVRIIGWGLDRGPAGNLKYWLCANSWGTDWGESGYFRIERGSNECEIESFVLGVWGKVEGDEELRRTLEESREQRGREMFAANNPGK
ncbi:Tubulointerstitial nephritis antigen-like [Mactra antiquata]